MSDTSLKLKVKITGSEWQEVTVSPGVLSLWELHGPETPEGVKYRSVANLTERTVDLNWCIWRALKTKTDFEDWLITVEDISPVEEEASDEVDPTVPVG